MVYTFPQEYKSESERIRATGVRTHNDIAVQLVCHYTTETPRGNSLKVLDQRMKRVVQQEYSFGKNLIDIQHILKVMSKIYNNKN